ncbi:MAG: hypothetical protein AB7P50_22150 [Alphaproteobacteria bacterium]
MRAEALRAFLSVNDEYLILCDGTTIARVDLTDDMLVALLADVSEVAARRFKVRAKGSLADVPVEWLATS